MDFLKKLTSLLQITTAPAKKSEFFSDPVPIRMMSNKYIPDVIFEADYILFNTGYNKEKDSFIAIVKPLHGTKVNSYDY